MADLRPMPRERRHTLRFLDEVRAFSPVFLDTEVDMTRVRAHRAAAAENGVRYSAICYVLHAAARVLVGHPDANAAVRGRIRPRLARHSAAHGKITLDRRLNGQRVVLSTVLPDLDTADLDTIQRQVDHLRIGDPETMEEFAGARLLHRTPWPVGPLLFRLGVRPLRRRAQTMGTFAVTSLAHRSVDGFHSIGGTTVTLGLGRTIDRPVVRDGRVEIAPIMRLNLTFDHRVVDGAEAADVLTEIRDALQSFGATAPRVTPPPVEAGTH